jgi:hypothetical protein
MRRNDNRILVWLLFVMLVMFGCASARPIDQQKTDASTMKEDSTQPVERPLVVPPEEAYRKAESGKALLVCAYADEAICETIHLKGGIFLQQLEAKLPTLSKSQEIIFYCR